MTQTEKLIRLYTQGWTSHHKATLNGCGGYPWKRWAEWAYDHSDAAFWINGEAIFCYKHVGKTYKAQTRNREVNGVRFLERRLVRVK